MAAPRTLRPAATSAPAPRAPAPAPARPLWLELLERAWEPVLVALAAYVLTQKLLALTGAALWLPKTLRVAINVFLPGVAVGFYTLARTAARFGQERWAARAGRDRAEVERARRTARLAVVSCAALALLVALVVFSSYMRLRDLCVVPFQPPVGWWEAQFGDDSLLTEEGRRLRGGVRPTSEDIADALEVRYALAAEELDERIPPFLNRATSEVYVPLAWDAGMTAALAVRGDGLLRAGLTDMLAHEPMLLVDWLQGEGAASLSDTTQAFLWRHALILLLTALAAGLVFTPQTSLPSTLSTLLGAGGHPAESAP